MWFWLWNTPRRIAFDLLQKKLKKFPDFYLKGKEGKRGEGNWRRLGGGREREKREKIQEGETANLFGFTSSFDSQQPGLGQAEACSCKPHPGLPRLWQLPKWLSHHLLAPKNVHSKLGWKQSCVLGLESLGCSTRCSGSVLPSVGKANLCPVILGCIFLWRKSGGYLKFWVIYPLFFNKMFRFPGVTKLDVFKNSNQSQQNLI